tara:strand:+ start:747 stop:1670 length:924 start_codon:yes stop_codon:yes gene_type:complete
MPKENSTRTFQAVLLKVLMRIKRRERFKSATAEQMHLGLGISIVNAALAKCLDVNVLANKKSVYKENAYILVANLRGICEDLIVLKYLEKLPEKQRDQYLSLLQINNLRHGILTQSRFFKANNPFQPIAGGNVSQAQEQLKASNEDLKDFWLTVNGTKRGPTVRDMAVEAGLPTTYEYIYFLSSNFVHFNPHTLLRTGWGPLEGPFEFSVHNMNGYYADLVSFYGALILVGFHSVFGDRCFTDDAKSDIDDIIEIIDQVPRWPELVTYEELNQKPPMLHFMTLAMRKVAEKEGELIEYGEILREVGI